MKQRLTTKVVAALKPAEKPYFVWDSPGFGVRVNPKGRKAFVVRFRVDSIHRTETLRTTNLDSARLEANARRASIPRRLKRRDVSVDDFMKVWEQLSDSKVLWLNLGRQLALCRGRRKVP